MLQILLLAIESDKDRVFVENLFINHQKKLKAIALSIVKDEHIAEDCVQDAFLGVIKNLEKFKSLSEIDQIKYLVISIKNACINKLKKKDKTLSLTKNEEQSEERAEKEITDETQDVFQIVITNELKAKVKECVEALDEKYRDVIVLRFQMGFNGKEISEILHISEPLVRQRIKRAKEIIKKKGGNELYDLFKWEKNRFATWTFSYRLWRCRPRAI